MPAVAVVACIDVACLSFCGYAVHQRVTLLFLCCTLMGISNFCIGAMYRAVTLYALEHGVINDNDIIDTPALLKVLPDIDVEFAVNPKTHNSDVFLKDIRY